MHPMPAGRSSRKKPKLIRPQEYADEIRANLPEGASFAVASKNRWAGPLDVAFVVETKRAQYCFTVSRSYADCMVKVDNEYDFGDPVSGGPTTKAAARAALKAIGEYEDGLDDRDEFNSGWDSMEDALAETFADAQRGGQ